MPLTPTQIQAIASRSAQAVCASRRPEAAASVAQPQYVKYPEDLWTKEFVKLVNGASMEASRHQGRILKPVNAGMVRDALKPEFHSKFSQQILDTPIMFVSKVNDKPFTGFAVGKQDGVLTLVMHPEQATLDYAPGFLHELQHLEDISKGKLVTPTEGMSYKEAIDLASEKRARDAEHQALPRTDLLQAIKSQRANIAAAVQKLYDEWQLDESGEDPELGSGGICDQVAGAIAGIFCDLGYETVEGGQEGDDHAFTIVHDSERAFAVDMPCQVYESGGGYSWKKREGVVIEPSDVVVYEVSLADVIDAGPVERRSPQAKEDWQMTQEEFLALVGYKKSQGSRVKENWIGQHEGIVRVAVQNRKPVPPEVLADYPDLAKAVPKAFSGTSETEPDLVRRLRELNNTKADLEEAFHKQQAEFDVAGNAFRAAHPGVPWPGSPEWKIETDKGKPILKQLVQLEAELAEVHKKLDAIFAEDEREVDAALCAFADKLTECFDLFRKKRFAEGHAVLQDLIGDARCSACKEVVEEVVPVATAAQAAAGVGDIAFRKAMAKLFEKIEWARAAFCPEDEGDDAEDEDEDGPEDQAPPPPAAG